MNSTSESDKHALSPFRFWLAGLTGVAALALAPSAFHAERLLETAAHVEGGEAEYVAQQLASRFRSPFVDRVVLVVEGLPAPDSEEGANAQRKIVDALDWLPPEAELVKAFHSLEKMRRAGIVQSLRVMLGLPSGSIPKSESGWNAVIGLSRRLAADPRADRVISISTLTDNNRDVARLTAETRRSLLGSDGGLNGSLKSPAVARVLP